jgi:hypothetical protein
LTSWTAGALGGVDHGRIVADVRGLLSVHPDLLGNSARRDVLGMDDRYEPRDRKASEGQVPGRSRSFTGDSLVPEDLVYVPSDLDFRRALEGQRSDAAVAKEVRGRE